MSGDPKLKSYVDRVKALLEQQKELGVDISEVCAEAKETAELEPSMIRYAARELLMDSAKRAKRDDKRHHYLHAVGLAVDMVSNGDVSLREAARVCGVSKSSVHRALAVPAVSPPARRTDIMPAAEAWQHVTATRLTIEAEEAERQAQVRAAKEAAKAKRLAEHAELARRNAEIDADDLTPPPGLDRRKQMNA